MGRQTDTKRIENVIYMFDSTNQIALRLIMDALASDEIILSVTETKLRLSTSRSRTCTLNSFDSPSPISSIALILGFIFRFTSTFDSIHSLFLQAVARMPL